MVKKIEPKKPLRKEKPLEEEEDIKDEEEESEEEESEEEELDEGRVPNRISSDDSDDDLKKPGVNEDYLQQYQFKKVNGKPIIGGKLSDPEKGSKAEVMKLSLLKQEKVSILIPLEPGSSPKIPYSITLNGYRLDLPVQEYVYVPMQVAEKIRKVNNQTIAALSKNRIDDGSDVDNALA